MSNKRVSRIVKAMQGWDITSKGKPSGLFGRKVVITSDDVKIDGDSLDVEFDVPFDNDTEANEAEIIVYNLSKNTINNLKYNQVITITAGYGKDTGIIFSGRISKVKTKMVGVDKQTTIYAIDDASLKEKDVEEISFAAGTKASYILKNLVQRLKLPIAVFKVRYDHTYENAVNVSGGLMDSIKKYAQVCGVSAYVLKGKVYVKHLNAKDTKSTNFNVCADTGLLEIEEFEEEIDEKEGDTQIYKEKIKGYTLKMLLQHRITTGTVIKLESATANGQFVVREGTHSFDGNNFTTECKVVS